MAQPAVDRRPVANDPHAVEAALQQPPRLPHIGDVLTACVKNNEAELEALLRDVKVMRPNSVYDLVDQFWESKKTLASRVLSWGNMAHKYLVLMAAANNMFDRRNRGKDSHDEPGEDGDEENYEEDYPAEDNEMMEEIRIAEEKRRAEELRRAEDICVYLVKQVPGLISYKDRSSQPTILHVAAKAESESLVEAIFASVTDRAAFGALLKIRNNQGKHGAGKTPLRVALEANFMCLVRRILEFNDCPIAEPELIKGVLASGKREVLLLLVKLRPSDMDEDVLEYAAQNKDKELIEALQNARECHRLFQNRELLHKMVKAKEYAIADALLDSFPQLALELDKQSKPVLFYTQNEETRAKIVPIIIRHVPSMDRSHYRCLFADENASETANLPAPSASEVVRALIADPPGKEISFSLGGFGSWASSAQSLLDLIHKSSTAYQLEGKPLTALQKVTFEETLIHVDIPVPDFPVPSATGIKTMVRSEVKLVLDWLNTKKAVKGIYELCVRDSCYLPHIESVIQACLTIFDNIEVLDWRRLDLSLHVLHTRNNPEALICRNLRTLRLYAGGWPAIAYWTSNEGLSFLCKFKQLKEVEIFILKEFVGSLVCDNYATEASKRFDAYKAANQDTSFTVFPMTKNWSDLSPEENMPQVRRETTSVEVTKLHSFLVAYDTLHRDFAEEPAWRRKNLLNPSEGEKNRTPYIKVAVIDNGVDPGSIDCHDISGASFVPSKAGESNWWHITHAHGTKMARIITQLNPHCCLLVAKVGESRSDFTSSRIIKALKWAVAAGADVVSISLTLDRDDPKLETAINKAVTDGVVIFASVHGEGGNKPGAGYPAQYPAVFAIGSANSKGDPSSGTVKDHVKYLFQGEKIVARTEYLGGLDDTLDITGPSVATAIAAGVASLVLACDRFALFRKPDFQRGSQGQLLQRSVVEKVFDACSDRDRKYVRPWTFFTEDKLYGSWGEGGSVLRWITKKFDATL